MRHVGTEYFICGFVDLKYCLALSEACCSPTFCLHYLTFIYSRRSELKSASLITPTGLGAFAAKSTGMLTNRAGRGHSEG